MLLTLYNSPSEYEKAFNEIHDIGIKVLRNTIDKQQKREQIIYKGLNLNIDAKNISKEDLTVIKNAIYKIDNNKPTIDKCMEVLVEHISNLIMEPTGNNEIDGTNLKRIIKEFDLMKKNGNEYLEKYFSSINNLGNSFNAQDFFSVIGNFNNILDNFSITEDKKEQFLNGQITLNKTQEILKKYSQSKNDIIGAIGEALAIYYSDMGDGIVATFTTSGWGTEKEKTKVETITKSGRKGKKTVTTRTSLSRNISGNNNIEAWKETFHKNNTDYIKNLNNKIKKEIDVESEDFNIRTGTEVKADEVYVIIHPEIKDSFFYFGISNKTSYSDSGILKIQTTSLDALTSNIYRVSELDEKGNLSNSEQTQGISGLLKTLAVNYVFSDWSEKDFDNFKNIVNFIVDYYGYVWFTGGIEDKSHADFFSAYSHGELHFIPMSYILKLIENSVSNGEKKHFFEPLALNYYRIPDVTSNSYNYNSLDKESYDYNVYNKKIEEIERFLKWVQNNRPEYLKNNYFLLKKKLYDDLMFSRNFMETLNHFNGIYTRGKHASIWDKNPYDEIHANDIIKKISKSEAPIRVNKINYGIIMG